MNFEREIDDWTLGSRLGLSSPYSDDDYDEADDMDDDGYCPDCGAGPDEECDEDCPSWEEDEDEE